jgi:hypothetical protein
MSSSCCFAILLTFFSFAVNHDKRQRRLNSRLIGASTETLPSSHSIAELKQVFQTLKEAPPDRTLQHRSAISFALSRKEVCHVPLPPLKRFNFVG